jgi:hypothetical protein
VGRDHTPDPERRVLRGVIETVHQLALFVESSSVVEVLSPTDTLVDMTKSAGERERV